MAKQRKDAEGGRRRLGRGLESLLSSPVKVEVPPRDEPSQAPDPPAHATVPPPRLQMAPPAAAADRGAMVQMLPLDAIRPSPHQPRRDFDEASLESLAQSIRSAGLMQPIVVRPDGRGGHVLIAGERRWRAAQRLGLSRIPAIAHEIDERTAAQWSLVENLQREDLNPLERAAAFGRLGDEFGLTHQEIAEQVGLDRTSVTNHLRLLELEESVQSLLRQGELSMGHGRALLAIANLDEQARLARLARQKQWSVRELERRLRHPRPSAAPSSTTAAPDTARLHLHDLQRRLGEHLGTRVTITTGRRKGAGRVVIDFYDLDQFEGLMQRLGFRCE